MNFNPEKCIMKHKALATNTWNENNFEKLVGWKSLLPSQMYALAKF